MNERKSKRGAIFGIIYLAAASGGKLGDSRGKVGKPKEGNHLVDQDLELRGNQTEVNDIGQWPNSPIHEDDRFNAGSAFIQRKTHIGYYKNGTRQGEYVYSSWKQRKTLEASRHIPRPITRDSATSNAVK